jgi:cytochrome b involved in lipid metabolism
MGKGSNNILIETENSHESQISCKSKLYYTREEVSRHNNKNDCWIIVKNEIYDLTKFQKIHPGGSRILNIYAGQDATEVFDAFHKELDRVNKYSKIYFVGKVNDFNSEKDLRNDFNQLRLLAFDRVRFKFLKLFKFFSSSLNNNKGIF